MDDLLANIDDEKRREDCRTVARLMQRITRRKPEMWGTAIVGFGSYHYKYASGVDMDVLTELIRQSVDHVSKSNK